MKKRQEQDDRQGHHDIGGRTCGRDEHAVAAAVAQVIGVDHHRFGPAENRGADHGQYQRENNGADQVDMGDGVEGDAALQARGGIAESVGGPGVSRFVDRNGEEHGGKLNDDAEYICHNF